MCSLGVFVDVDDLICVFNYLQVGTGLKISFPPDQSLPGEQRGEASLLSLSVLDQLVRACAHDVVVSGCLIWSVDRRVLLCGVQVHVDEGFGSEYGGCLTNWQLCLTSAKVPNSV